VRKCSVGKADGSSSQLVADVCCSCLLTSVARLMWYSKPARGCCYLAASRRISLLYQRTKRLHVELNPLKTSRRLYAFYSVSTPNKSGAFAIAIVTHSYSYTWLLLYWPTHSYSRLTELFLAGPRLRSQPCLMPAAGEFLFSDSPNDGILTWKRSTLNESVDRTDDVTKFRRYSFLA